jgi:hypothetical protein
MMLEMMLEMMLKLEIRWRRRVWSTASKAFEMSPATMAVWVGGFVSLKLLTAAMTTGRRAEVVDRKGRKPC